MNKCSVNYRLFARHCIWLVLTDIENAWRHSYCPQGVYSITRKLKVKLLSNVQLFVTPWAVAYQAPLSMGFSRQEYWSGLPFPSPGDLPDPGIEPGSPTLQADTWPSELQGRSIIRGGNKNLRHIVYTCHTFIHLFPWWTCGLFSGILVIERKPNWLIWRDVNGPRDCHTEWGKSERQKHMYGLQGARGCGMNWDTT